MRIIAWLYTFFIRIYVLGIRIAATRNVKAKQWLDGRKFMWDELAKNIGSADRTIWFHCASAGELEQGKPLIEVLKEDFPEHKIVISFFSPSGYQAGLKYKAADVITWLPADTATNAKRFIEAVHPELAIFIKYEFWYHHLSAAAFRHIPILMASAIFRQEQVFFKWYGKFFRQILFLFRQLFVQDEASQQLLASHAIPHVTVSGDTRFDRVKKIAAAHQPVDELQSFFTGGRMIVAGSTWPEDEDLLSSTLKHHDARLLVIPHEISPSHLQQILKKFPGAELLSAWKTGDRSRVLVVDGYGLLSRLYFYADICYIGGGFNKSGIHNTLEAAVYGKPVIFGPHYQKFREARDMVAEGAAFPVTDASQLGEILKDLLNDPGSKEKAGRAAAAYVERNTGATKIILDYIQANRLLTR